MGGKLLIPRFFRYTFDTGGNCSNSSSVSVLPLNSQFLPKPILIEKISSEPNSPTSKTTAFVNSEHRTTTPTTSSSLSSSSAKGSGDSHQIKKKVTLRLETNDRDAIFIIIIIFSFGKIFFSSSFPSSNVSSSIVDESGSGRENTKDVVIIVPTSGSGCVQTVVAIDNDPDNSMNDSSGEFFFIFFFLFFYFQPFEFPLANKFEIYGKDVRVVRRRLFVVHDDTHTHNFFFF